MKYRSEIDGLRALAVLPVILFHAGFGLFGGGFVGVDVFFVISGYLITTIIISEMQNDKFSIINFYERRARRILPALFFVMLVSIPFAWFFLNPFDLKDFAESLIAVSFFSSNILFWLESGYFDTAAELKPLLHTWSLAVEEQYYIIFPIFLIITWKLGIRWILVILLIIFILSLSAAQWGAYNSPSANFYLLPTRGWELLVGVFTAFYLKYKSYFKSYTLNEFLSLSGFGMVAYSILIFDKTTPFPSIYALMPTIGTGLIILCAVPKTIVHKLLSLKLIVGIGLISYSAYLWHQPILAFARHMSIDEVSDVLLLILCLLSLIAGWFSWRFVEKPFRDKAKFNRKQIFIFSLSGILFFSCMGVFFANDNVRFNAPSSLSGIKYSSLRDKISTIGQICNSEDIYHESAFNYCEIGSKKSNYSVIIFGDSHLEAIQYVLDEKFKELGIRGIYIKEIKAESEICETTIFTFNSNKNFSDTFLKCENSYQSALESFSDSEFLILLSRWSMKYFFEGSEIKTPHFENKALNCIERDIPYMTYIPFGKNVWKEANEKNMALSINNLLKLSTSKIKTILVYPIPEIGCDPFKFNMFNKRLTGKRLETLSFPVSEYDKRNKFVINNFDNFVSNNKDLIIPIRPKNLFCKHKNNKNCIIIENSMPLYLDDDHVSDIGAKLIVDDIANTILLSK